MAKRISDLTTTSALQSGDYFEVSRSTSSLKRDMFDELGDNFGAVSNLLWNVGVRATVASSALTIFMTQADGATNPGANSARCRVSFRSSTLSDGSITVVDAVATTSTVISVGSTAGLGTAESAYIYVYALNNAGTIELAWSASGGRDEGILWTTTAEGGAGAADSRTTLYSTTARSNVAIRLIGKLTISEILAGSWTTAPSAIISAPQNILAPPWLPYPSGVYSFPSGNQTAATAGTLLIGAATTAPTFGTGTILLAWYRDWGSTIDLYLRLQQTVSTGANSGSGLYYVPLPLGKSFNSSFITPDNSNIHLSTRVGKFSFTCFSSDTYMFDAEISPQAATYFALHGPYSNSNGVAQLAIWNNTGIGNPAGYSRVNVGGIVCGIPVV